MSFVFIFRKSLTLIVGLVFAVYPFCSWAALANGTFAQIVAPASGPSGAVAGLLTADLLEFDQQSFPNPSVYRHVVRHLVPGDWIRKSLSTNLNSLNPQTWWINDSYRLYTAQAQNSLAPIQPMATPVYSIAEWDLGTVVAVTDQNRLVLLDRRKLVPNSVPALGNASVVDPSIYGQILDIHMVSDSQFVAVTDKLYLIKVETFGDVNRSGKVEFEVLLPNTRLTFSPLPNHAIDAGVPSDVVSVVGGSSSAWVLVRPSTPLRWNGYWHSFVVRFDYHSWKPQAAAAIPYPSGSKDLELLGTENAGRDLILRAGNSYEGVDSRGMRLPKSALVFAMSPPPVGGPILSGQLPLLKRSGAPQILIDHPKEGHQSWVPRSAIPLHTHSKFTLKAGSGTQWQITATPPTGGNGTVATVPSSVGPVTYAQPGSSSGVAAVVPQTPPNTADPKVKRDFLALFLKEFPANGGNPTVKGFFSQITATYGPRYALDYLSDAECLRFYFTRTGKDTYAVLPGHEKEILDLEKLSEKLEEAYERSCNGVVKS
ncbi:MAG TPA: hypothetical protein PLH57_03455 [Oligoflexia bacterium]|nr:hypothetical protein [Oligoflexia bacterium]